MLKRFLICIAGAALVCGCGEGSATARHADPATKPAEAAAKPVPAEIAAKLVPDANNKVHLTDAEWQQILTPDEFIILRKEGTEPPFKNAYHDNHASGKYLCRGCGQELFDSDQKFDSGTGWPSFWQPAVKANVLEKIENDPVNPRTEVECSRCEGHLGHVFKDGPKPTGLRYCIDSASLRFVPR